MPENSARIFFKIIILFILVFLLGCGAPKIQIQDQAVYPKDTTPMVPAIYLLGQGDELEILYHIDPGFSVADYVIETEDTLRVDLFYYPAMGRSVKVRPDGVITLPLVGEVRAAGIKPRDLASAISKIYAPHVSKPSVTVEVIEFNAKVEDLKRAVTTQDRGQSRLVLVRPDGMISLPYVRDVPAAGKTAYALSAEIEKQYRKFLSNISITVAVLRARSNRVYISGQVGRPGFQELLGPITLTQLIAQAGGLADYANTHQIVVISRTSKGLPTGMVFDLDDIIGMGDLRADPMIKQYDVVFVPRTRLAKAALAGDALWRMIPLRFTAAASAAYSLGGSAAD